MVVQSVQRDSMLSKDKQNEMLAVVNEHAWLKIDRYNTAPQGTNRVSDSTTQASRVKHTTTTDACLQLNNDPTDKRVLRVGMATWKGEVQRRTTT
eukprot:m.351879 g.351879  ORF g.351879 m.351879 type:complete len:95 (+) comp16387_c0_seq1:33-317(+)